MDGLRTARLRAVLLFEPPWEAGRQSRSRPSMILSGEEGIRFSEEGNRLKGRLDRSRWIGMERIDLEKKNMLDPREGA